MSKTTKPPFPKTCWNPYTTSWDEIKTQHYPGSGTDSEPYAVSWLPNDEENPMNWNPTFQWFVTLIASSLTFVFTFASSAYSGAIPSIIQEFPGPLNCTGNCTGLNFPEGCIGNCTGGYDNLVYIAGLSLYVLGFALGPLLWAPLSEIYGRRPVLLVSFAGFTAFNGGVIASQNIWTISILRFFAGALGSSVTTNSGGTISDLFTAKKRGLGISLFAAAPFLGPGVGPLIGGFLGHGGGWRWVMALITILSGIFLVLASITCPETYAPVLLRKRAAKLTAEAGGPIYRAVYDAKTKLRTTEVWKKALLRPWQLLLFEPIVVFLSIYIAIVYGTLYLLFAAFPIVYQQQRGWGPGLGGLAFLGVLAGFMLAVLYQIFIENPRYIRYLEAHGGRAPPEQRLIEVCVGGVFLPAGMFWFAWTAAPPSIPWIVSILAGVPFGFGMVLVFLGVLLYLIDAYLIYAASVSAANTVLRSLAGAAFPLFTSAMYHNLGINWASTLVAFLALVCTPFPIILYFFGPAIRKKCPYAKEAAMLLTPQQRAPDISADSNKSTQSTDTSSHHMDTEEGQTEPEVLEKTEDPYAKP